jgi:site-specific recombinase XerD
MNNKLLIGTQKPHKSVTKSTVARWIRMFLNKAGVLEHYTPHSIRTAAASSANSRGIPLSCILKTAGWQNARTFNKFYNKQIVEDHTMQMCLLD